LGGINASKHRQCYARYQKMKVLLPDAISRRRVAYAEELSRTIKRME
jgi:hypothetical protein